MCGLFGFVAAGVDRSAARREGSRNVKIYPEIEDLKDAPEVGKGFHAITLFETLEHLDQPLDILNELTQYLLPGGILVLETPDCRGVNGIETEQDYRLIPTPWITSTPSIPRRFAVSPAVLALPQSSGRSYR